MSKSIINLCILILLAINSTSKTLDCLDNNGKSVGWFFDYKFPGNVSADTPRHGYVDSRASASGFEILNGFVDAQGQALYNTMKLINEFSNLNLIAFNDEPPSDPWVPDGAHAKGFIAFDNVSQTGVYVMHSAPKFPNVSIDGKVNTSLPSNSRVYGQHFYCTTIDSENGLHQIINHLKVIYPVYYYRSGIFAEHSFRGSEIKTLVTNYYLGDGEEAWILSKSPNYTDGFLYENVVEPYFKLGLEVESWGRPYQDAVCNKTYESLNIVQVNFSSEFGWDHYSDHSKWALTLSPYKSSQYACGCDINRMDSQALRGGSCICTRNQILYNSLKALIKDADSCSRNSTRVETLKEEIVGLKDEIVNIVKREIEDYSDIFSDSDI